jgi:hypothetical protein
MDPTIDPQPLLKDLFAEDASPEFRRASFQATLRAARARRRRGQAVRALAVAALVASVVTPRLRPRRSTGGAKTEASTLRIVLSKPSSATSMVETRAGDAQLVATSAGFCRTIETREARSSPRQISDDQLLALFAERPVALVRVEPPAARLVFLDDSESESSP